MKIIKICIIFVAFLLMVNISWAAEPVILQPSDIEKVKVDENVKEGVDYYIDDDGSSIRHDIQERDLEVKSIINKAQKEAEESVAKDYGGKLPDLGGVCGLIWAKKKSILKEKYNLNWRSPQELNPSARFD